MNLGLYNDLLMEGPNRDAIITNRSIQDLTLGGSDTLWFMLNHYDCFERYNNMSSLGKLLHSGLFLTISCASPLVHYEAIQ